MASEVEIDDALYSRQRYVLGDSAMKRIAKSNILLCGLGCVGVEIAKNVILAGVKSITIQDSKQASYQDMAGQFFLSEEDVTCGRNRAEACCTKLAELNPYVSVKTLTTTLNEDTDLAILREYQCVIVTEVPLCLSVKINEFCRLQQPPIKFILADVYGVFCWTFVDLGPEFEVFDINGEEPKDVFISKITKENPGVVTTLENFMHDFETGDTITFKEIKGMKDLNGMQCQIKVLSPTTFSICDTSAFNSYESGGVASQVKIPKATFYESLAIQLKKPSLQTPDLSKMEAPANIHVGMWALHRFWEANGRLPNIRCSKDAASLTALSHQCNEELEPKVPSLDEQLLRYLSYTCQGSLAPLGAFLGGVVAQEVIKAVTGKFMPLNQWLHLDATELLSDIDEGDSFNVQQNKYDAIRVCVGSNLCEKLANQKLFMVGCGAIGCEMLKNYAMLGIGTKPHGKITITDNDLIEKSNLNRQFLFRPHHIRQPKSTCAAQSACEINPDLNIVPHQYKVCPQTESSVYTDTFFEAQNIIVNALDNVEARRYVDSRCVTNQRPLLESGTMGSKGHVQVIVPHLTESYGSQQDPADRDIPYCTLKSFPAVIEHCIQWARDKFESSFAQKPALFNKFWKENLSLESVMSQLENGAVLEGAVQTSKITSSRPQNWHQCVALAREKFEKYFNHKAKHLLHAFPLDHLQQDGSMFWQSPKRPPTPQVFDPNNKLHMDFIGACARLYAEISGVKVGLEDLNPTNLFEILKNIPVPEFRPTTKKIETDEAAAKPSEEDESSGDEMKMAATRIRKTVNNTPDDGVLNPMMALEFEKDDDTNYHIAFITAASNLRANMYSIENADHLKTKRIAGRIVPAIATTTAAVAGLVTIELLKIVKKSSLDKYKNCFLNLALPFFLFSEPGPVEKSKLSNGVEYSLWDRWEVHGNSNFTLTDFVSHFAKTYNLEVTMVVQAVKMIYVPMMPGHKRRLPQTMLKLLKPSGDKPYTDLVVSYANPQTDEDQMGPPVRYFYG